TPQKRQETILSILCQGADLRRIPLSNIHSLIIRDSYFQEQLAKRCRQELECRKPPKKASGKTAIVITAVTKEKKDNAAITTSYLSKSQEWKCTYRLEVSAPESDKDPAKKSSSTALQGILFYIILKIKSAYLFFNIVFGHVKNIGPDD